MGIRRGIDHMKARVAMALSSSFSIYIKDIARSLMSAA